MAETFRQSFLWSIVPDPYAGVCLHLWLKSIVLQSQSREQNPFPSFLCHAEEELCLYQHSCQQMLLGPVSTSTMFNFSLNRPDLTKQSKTKKRERESELWSKCTQLLGTKLGHSAAAGVHIQLLPAAVLGHQRYQCSPGSCSCQCGAKLGVLPQSIICPLLCSDGKLPPGEVLTWRFSAVFYFLRLMCNFPCRPSWSDISYCFQKKYVRHKQEACLCALVHQWQNWSSRVE